MPAKKKESEKRVRLAVSVPPEVAESLAVLIDSPRYGGNRSAAVTDAIEAWAEILSAQGAERILFKSARDALDHYTRNRLG